MERVCHPGHNAAQDLCPLEDPGNAPGVLYAFSAASCRSGHPHPETRVLSYSSIFLPSLF